MAGAPRAALRRRVCGFISEIREVARGVTAMVVGSGALLGVFSLLISIEQIEPRLDVRSRS